MAVWLPNPSRVIRPNGTRPQLENHLGFWPELKEMAHLIKRKEVLLLVPISIYAQWSASYLGTFLSLTFSVRSRALASFLVPITALGVNFILGVFLDNSNIRKHIRCQSSYVAVMTALGGCWAFFSVLQARYLRAPVKGLDWSDRSAYAPFACYIITYTFYFVLQNHLYFVFSQ